MKIDIRHFLGTAFPSAAVIAMVGSGLLAPAASALAALPASETNPPTRPTIVLVHGAFADSASWNGVVARLHDQGYPVVAAALPLRGLQSDADYVATLLRSIPRPIVVVGHSYGGSVITVAATGNPNVRALVYVAAFAPEVGESADSLGSRFPGATLGDALAAPVVLSDGGKDLYIQQDKFRSQFSADVPEADSILMAATQRPIVESALHETAKSASWHAIPSWFVFGSLDKNITEAAHQFMAQRAGAKETVDINGASHVVMVSHPDTVAALIDRAATFAASASEAPSAAPAAGK